jgi:hypothetical protein
MDKLSCNPICRCGRLEARNLEAETAVESIAVVVWAQMAAIHHHSEWVRGLGAHRRFSLPNRRAIARRSQMLNELER